MPDLGATRSIVIELEYNDFKVHSVANATESNPILLARWKVTKNIPSGFDDQLIGYSVLHINANGKHDGGGGNLFIGWLESPDNGATWDEDLRSFTSNPSFVFMAQNQGGSFLSNTNPITDIAVGMWGTTSAVLGTIREVNAVARLLSDKQFSFRRTL